MISWQKTVPGLGEATLRRFILKACRAAGLAGEVDVLITSNLRMRALNRRFRGKDKATDVLSFPSAEVQPTFKGHAINAGDIAISAEIAARNAHQLGHSAASEVKILVLHGILHLAGYDHETDNGTMARKESRLRRKLHLPSGLIGRDALSKGPSSSSASGAQKRRRTA